MYADSVNNRINRRLMSYDLRRRHYCHIYITFIHVGDTDCKVKAVVACLKWLKELSKKHYIGLFEFLDKVNRAM